MPRSCLTFADGGKVVADEWEPVRGGTLGDAFEVIYGDQVAKTLGQLLGDDHG